MMKKKPIRSLLFIKRIKKSINDDNYKNKIKERENSRYRCIDDSIRYFMD